MWATGHFEDTRFRLFNANMIDKMIDKMVGWGRMELKIGLVVVEIRVRVRVSGG